MRVRLTYESVGLGGSGRLQGDAGQPVKSREMDVKNHTRTVLGVDGQP